MIVIIKGLKWYCTRSTFLHLLNVCSDARGQNIGKSKNQNNDDVDKTKNVYQYLAKCVKICIFKILNVSIVINQKISINQCLCFDAGSEVHGYWAYDTSIKQIL